MLDEREGIPIASVLVDKGFENVYLLSGGIEKFLEECNELVEGQNVPEPKSKAIAEKQKKISEVKKIKEASRHAHCKKS